MAARLSRPISGLTSGDPAPRHAGAAGHSLLWVDHGYNRPATISTRAVEKNAQAEHQTVPAQIYHGALRHGLCGMPDPAPEMKRASRPSARHELEPFQRGMKELAPVVWLTALRKVQNPNRAGLDIVSEDTNSTHSRSARCSTGATLIWKNISPNTTCPTSGIILIRPRPT